MIWILTAVIALVIISNAWMKRLERKDVERVKKKNIKSDFLFFANDLCYVYGAKDLNDGYIERDGVRYGTTSYNYRTRLTRR